MYEIIEIWIQVVKIVKQQRESLVIIYIHEINFKICILFVGSDFKMSSTIS